MFFRYACAAVLFTALAVPAAAADLRVTVEGVNSDPGKIMVALHQAEDGVKFPESGGVISGQWSRARSGAVTFIFTDLAPGRYAAAAFHDADDNGELDANVIGIPLEGYGFSEKATGSFGRPHSTRQRSPSPPTQRPPKLRYC
jgi:uncharacterized protein (DUF2141 family)